MALPPVPEAMKSLKKYLKTAKEFETRNPIISYQCKLHAAQQGIAQFGKDKQNLPFLMKLLDIVEMEKATLKKNPETFNDVVVTSTLQETAYKLFDRADTEDRKGNFDQKVIHAFLTATILLEVLAAHSEGALDEEGQAKLKYARFKAFYISKCVKEGMTPVPGPIDENGNPILDEPPSFVSDPSPAPFDSQGYRQFDTDNTVVPQNYGFDTHGGLGSHSHPPVDPHPSSRYPYQELSDSAPKISSLSFDDTPKSPVHHAPQPSQPHPTLPSSLNVTFATPAKPTPAPSSGHRSSSAGNAHQMLDTLVSRDELQFQEIDEVSKQCKYALSALQYSDIETAMICLVKALKGVVKP